MPWFCDSCNAFCDVYRISTVSEAVIYSKEDKELFDYMTIENIAVIEEGTTVFCNDCGNDDVEWREPLLEQKKVVNYNE